ncbi:thioredoxin domain-containing protein [Candidatus Gottesmanbacteria bacterium]|nr:thioredoxin domain-containing protein [Candidatus Gottesmanbacteria bacterium]
MNNEIKIFSGIIAGTLILIFGAAFIFTQPKKPVDAGFLVRGNSFVLGASEAKVTVVEFSDFQCPACKSAEPIITAVLTQYKDKIKFVYRHYPLPNHEFAMIAAQAAEAAALQNKFWEYHDKLFEKSPDLSRENLIILAKDLNLDMDKFTKDLDSDVVKQKVADDQADGNRAGVNATPTFYINGTQFTGVLPLSQFQQEIEKRLK